MELMKDRVKLRLMTQEDARVLFSIVNENPEIWTFMPAKMHSLQDMENVISDCLKKHQMGEVLPFIVEDLWSKRIVGSTRLYDISVSHKTVEMGYTFYSPLAQRTSINTESKYLLLKHAFEELGMKRVQIKTDLRNEKAQRAIERLGAVKEGIIRNERMLHDGHVRDAVLYNIIEEEWKLIKERLETYLLSKGKVVTEQ